MEDNFRASGADEAAGTCGLEPRDGESLVRRRSLLETEDPAADAGAGGLCSTSKPSLPRRKLRARL